MNRGHSTVRRVAKNSFFILLGEATAALLALLLNVFLARQFGDVGFGKYSFAFSFTLLFLVFADLGLSVLSIREIARAPQKTSEYLTTVSLIKLVLSLITVGLIALVINLMNYPQDTRMMVYIFGFIVIFSSFAQFFRSIFRAFEKMQYEAITRITERVLVVAFALVSLFLGYGLTKVVLAILLAQAIATLLTLAVCIKRFTKPRLSFDFSLSRQLIKAALPFGIATIFLTIYFQTDTIMLSIMKGDAVVGWYNAASRLATGMLFIPIAFTGAIYPVLSKYFVSSKDSLVITYQKSLKFLIILAIPLAIGTTLVAERVILFLYGSEFANSAIALQILVWAISLIFVAQVVGYTLASINRQMVDTRITAAAALLNVVLNLILIPKFSYIGASAASVFSQTVVFVLEFSYLQKYLYKIKILELVWKPLGASVVMGIFIYILLNAAFVHILVIILGAVAVYAGLLYAFRAFDKDELQLAKSIFRRV
jgi:O-antigen/teichoic acid export membrane protein